MYTRRDGGNTERIRPNEAQRPISGHTSSFSSTQTTPYRGDESLIAPDDTFEGQLRTDSGVRILGTLRGTIESARSVYIEENAVVEADITAEEVVIAGQYRGTVSCRQRLEIRSTGHVTGRIETARLQMHEGGFFEGEMHMQTPAPADPSPSASKSERRGGTRIITTPPPEETPEASAHEQQPTPASSATPSDTAATRADNATDTATELSQ